MEQVRKQMGYFDDIGQVDPASSGNRLTPGVYTVRVVDCSVHEGFHGARFVAELEVIESSGPDALAVGSIGSWTARIDGQWGSIGLGEVKAFVGACLGLSDDAEVKRVVDSTMMSRVTEQSHLKGRTVATDAWAHTTKSGQRMVKHAWAPSAVAAVAPPPPAPVAAAPFPPPGWAAHPSSPGYYYRGQDVLSEAQLRAQVGGGA